MVDSFSMIAKYCKRNFMTLRPSFRNSAYEESTMRAMTINSWLYCNKTWLNALKVKTGAHAGPLHQGPWKASYMYAPAFAVM